MATGDRYVSLLSSQARVQVPQVKITIGDFTFGAYTKNDSKKFYGAVASKYPNYVQNLTIKKINGQVNTYSLNISYPVTPDDDPNFFDKILSSVSGTRKIVFSYGDISMPNYIYKEEEAIITDVRQTFSFGNGGMPNSVIGYIISAISSVGLSIAGNKSFMNSGKRIKPSDEIKRILQNSEYGLNKVFTGIDSTNIDTLIRGDDKEVFVESKSNISPLDYIIYLVSCMTPATSIRDKISKDIYILTIHDETTYDSALDQRAMVNGKEIRGPYIRVDRTDYSTEHSDAYVIDIGYNTSTIVTNFQITNNESYSLYYDYQEKLNDSSYVRRLNNRGQQEEIYAPAISSKNDLNRTTQADTTWQTKTTKYPISATITIQGLLRPATLMSYVRLNVIFPGGNSHNSSGLYIVTSQTDEISGSGCRTTLTLTRIDT